MTDLTRRAIIHVDTRQLIKYLELPDDVSIVAVVASNDPVGVQIIVTKPDLPAVDINAMAPFVQKMVTRVGDDFTTEYLWPTEEDTTP